MHGTKWVQQDRYFCRSWLPNESPQPGSLSAALLLLRSMKSAATSSMESESRLIVGLCAGIGVQRYQPDCGALWAGV